MLSFCQRYVTVLNIKCLSVVQQKGKFIQLKLLSWQFTAICRVCCGYKWAASFNDVVRFHFNIGLRLNLIQLNATNKPTDIYLTLLLVQWRSQGGGD